MSSSTEIKKALVEQFGGAASNWKRLSKGKNAEGIVEREFFEKKNGDFVTVLEEASGNEYRRESSVSKPALGSMPVLETNRAALAAAREVIHSTALGGEGFEMDDLPELTEKANDLAYANFCLFAVVQISEDEYCILHTLKKSFQDNPYHDDDIYVEPVNGLLPQYAEDLSGTNCRRCYLNPDENYLDAGTIPAPSPLDAAKDMLERGFFWTPEYQAAAEDYVRNSVGQEEMAISSGAYFNVQDIQNLLSAPVLPMENKPALDL